MKLLWIFFLLPLQSREKWEGVKREEREKKPDFVFFCFKVQLGCKEEYLVKSLSHHQFCFLYTIIIFSHIVNNAFHIFCTYFIFIFILIV